MQIDDTKLNKYCENEAYKSILSVNESDVIKEYFKYQTMNNIFTEKSNAYELSNTMKSFSFWFSKRDSEPNYFPVQPGQVYYVDLGAYNLKYETGFIHSCLILKQCSTMILIVPGSTKKYGKKIFLIEDINAGDGFKENTGILIDQMRFVSITRIRGKLLGTVHPDTLERVEKKIFQNSFPRHFQKFSKLEMDNKKYLEQINEKNENINDLEINIKEKELELLQIKRDLEELKVHNCMQIE